MRRLISRLLMIIVPIGILVSLTNYFVDPANIFSSATYIGGIADILSKGHNVDNLSDFDERLLQENLFKRRRSIPDVVVMGSSRVMEIGSDFFPAKSVMNCGVSHGDMNDLIAITGLIDSLRLLPQKFVIGIDPNVIGKGGSRDWQSLYPYYDYFVRKFDSEYTDYDRGLPNSYRKLFSFFSLSYFKSSLQFVFERHSKKYTDVNTALPLSGRFSDGTIAYSATYRIPATLKAVTDLTGLRDGLPLPDPVKIALLNGLLDFLQSRHVSIKIVMTPFNREFVEAIGEKQPGLLKRYDSLVREIASKRSIPVFGGLDPVKTGIPPGQFYDMYHCSKTAIKKLFTDN